MPELCVPSRHHIIVYRVIELTRPLGQFAPPTSGVQDCHVRLDLEDVLGEVDGLATVLFRHVPLRFPEVQPGRPVGSRAVPPGLGTLGGDGSREQVLELEVAVLEDLDLLHDLRHLFGGRHGGTLVTKRSAAKSITFLVAGVTQNVSQ